ncbi:2-hydroxycarboxylate transporter family protein [Glutamicibacter sp.]|jgi:Na+/citrate symporter|uniref:2-hydroxycarboxylate transporter family protein n=1 Tax=Glutamicibacter sp. TaxID=1931995 RepID=UPI002B45AA96|nr:2-hydroxycarboxylate transporter family protein [Glutamicibacter sp.]HJX79659.1 2-hydroxycarboxylate transporter family protein [Glutamicibacter sp.]
MSQIKNENLDEQLHGSSDEKHEFNKIKSVRTADRTTRAVHLPRKPTGRIASLPILLYLVLAAVVVIAAFTGTLPDSMLAGFVTTILFGGLLIWIGNLVPVIRDFGLPTILCTFIPATLLFAGLLPEQLVLVVTNFVTVHGFLDFFVITVIAGSILGMPRALLLKAGPRFAVPLVGCMIVTFLVVGGIGMITGFGFIEAILLIAAPIMAGGLGLGALPMSEMYAERTGQDSSAFMGDLMSAVVVANIFCILIAGIYNGLGKRKKQLFVGFNGHGQLLRINGTRGDLTLPPKRDVSSFIALGKGLAIAGGLFVFGQLVGSFAEFLHPYAWTIIAAAVVKIFGLLPKEVEDAATDWGDLVTATMVPALLVGVSISYIDISEVLVSLSNPRFIFLTVVTVVVATLSSGLLGWLVKFYFVEASITPGLVMADTGGSGDVSVLSAANRMHLMPFAALTNRIGGALVLFITSMLVPFLAIG